MVGLIFLLDSNSTPIVYRFRPKGQASLEEKRVSINKITLKCTSFSLATFCFCGGSFDEKLQTSNFLFKAGKVFGNWEWTEVGKLFSVKNVRCGT